MKLIMLGAPGAGKGTQAAILSEKLSIPSISTGDLLRAAVRDGTPVGRQVESYMASGKLVPDEVVIAMVCERLSEEDCRNGFILDGMPRTIAQGEALEEAGILIDAVLSFEIADEVIEERMEGRRFCPKCGATYHITHVPPQKEGVCDKCGTALDQREDDKPETVRRRLRLYHEMTSPLKEFYAQRGVLKTVENQPSIEATSALVLEALGI